MGRSWETFKVKGDELLKRVKEIVREGNARRVVVKQGARTVIEFPVTVGVVGALAAPALAALGALAALLTECTIEVEREGAASPKAAYPKAAGRRRPGSLARRPAEPLLGDEERTDTVSGTRARPIWRSIAQLTQDVKSTPLCSSLSCRRALESRERLVDGAGLQASSSPC